MNRRKRKAIWSMVLLLLLMGGVQSSGAAPEQGSSVPQGLMGPGQSSKAESSQEEKPAGKDVAQRPTETVLIQTITPGHGTVAGNLAVSKISFLSAAEMPDSIPHFRAFVTAVTRHVEARLAKEQIFMDSVGKNRFLLQFVRWPLFMNSDFLVPVLSPTQPRSSDSCWLSSPWIDLIVDRGPVPQIRGVVRWNDRQLLADQAALSGARNVPQGMTMPLKGGEYGHFLNEYVGSELRGKPATKPIEERIPPDMLWLFNRSGGQPGMSGLRESFGGNMDIAIKKGADSYTKLVIALIDRCFDSGGTNIRYGSGMGPNLYYGTILDAANLIPLEQYKIDSLTR